MIRYEELVKRPGVFKSLRGVSVPEFDELLSKVSLVWRQQE